MNYSQFKSFLLNEYFFAISSGPRDSIVRKVIISRKEFKKRASVER